MLEESDYDLWLDPEYDKTDTFHELLNTGIRKEISVTPVDSPNNMKVIGEKELITAKAA